MPSATFSAKDLHEHPMLERWLGTSTAGPNLTPAQRASLNQQRMYEAALPFAQTGVGLPEEL